jgi:hypothetical protein
MIVYFFMSYISIIYYDDEGVKVNISFEMMKFHKYSYITQTLYYCEMLNIGNMTDNQLKLELNIGRLLTIQNKDVFKKAIFDSNINQPAMYRPYRNSSEFTTAFDQIDLIFDVT